MLRSTITVSKNENKHMKSSCDCRACSISDDSANTKISSSKVNKNETDQRQSDRNQQDDR